jgi:transmembrane sensor
VSDSRQRRASAARIADEAAAWVVRCERGLGPAEQDDLSQWLAADPQHGTQLARHRRHWRRLDQLVHWQPQHSAIPNPDLLAPGLGIRCRRLLVPSLALMAAAIVLALFLRSPDATLSSRSNPAAPLLPLAGQHMLPDGSSVELNRGAAVDLRYTDRERRVLLREGEAHFIVTKGDPRPFVVAARSIDVRAVGTAFNVRVDAGVVEVLVTEGRVRVDATPAGNRGPTPRHETNTAAPLIPVLTTRQRAVVSLAPQLEPPRIATLTAVEIERVLAWQHRLLHFTDAPLSEILAEFNRRNRVQLNLLEPELAAVHLTVTFRSDNIDGFVHLLKAGFALQAEHRGEADIILHKDPARERRP